jgi:hypothetical protein
MNYAIAFCVTYSSTLKIEATDSSKLLVPVYQITQWYILEFSNVSIHCWWISLFLAIIDSWRINQFHMF